MNVLCNLPLECFESRSAFSQRIVTFGPHDRMWVDGVHYPFDVAFDPSRGTIDELISGLPAGFQPDVLLLYWPDQEPLPLGLESCPFPVVGVISDYNLSLPYISGLWPFFDLLLVDRSGVELMRKLSFADVRPFCQFAAKVTHRLYPDVPRDLDVAFAGNLNPVVQRDRMPWIERLRQLGSRGVSCEIRSGIFGEDYGRFLNRAKIGFNRSIRGEMNLRAFEVPACGALLFMEEGNLELAEFLTPGEEVVVYDDDNFEDLVCELLADEPMRERIARAGHERIREQGMPKRIDELERMLAAPGPGRPTSTEFERALGRGVAMLPTWVPEAATMQCLLAAAKLEPADPRPHNALALAMLHPTGGGHAQQAAHLLQKACALSPSYVPAALNLAWLLQAAGDDANARRCHAEVESRLSKVADWRDLDGPVLPLGFSERAIDVARALGDAVLAGRVDGNLRAWQP